MAERNARQQTEASGQQVPPHEAPRLVVGLGASAGGIEALQSFFSHLPEADGMAFVVILHLPTEYESRLAEVLQNTMPMPVTQVTGRVRLEAGHVYVIPPNKSLLAEDGMLVLEEIEQERLRRVPIDHFFRTLAEAWGERAVGIILSGTGSNGSIGARRIKEHGGLVLVQDPREAEFDGMPRNAAAAGVADLVLRTSEMGGRLVEYATWLREPERLETLAPDDTRTLHKILAQLRMRTGHDFAHYKRSTVLRRLERRLHVTGNDGLEDYLVHLRGHPYEAVALQNELLISVTNFFRDPAAFEVLSREVIPGLLKDKQASKEVRVWVAGCATGEEAYSIAMLLVEGAAELLEAPPIRVFATDMSEDAIRIAREGLYPASIEADVSAARLKRFFTQEGDHYRVRQALREQVLFARHSLLRDPPFSRLDLVTCRNVLIYLQRDLQQQVLELFHYVLRPGGYLFLGMSETVDGAADHYRTVSKATRLYRRADIQASLPQLPRAPRTLALPDALPPVEPGFQQPEARHADLHRRLKAEVSPPSVLVNANYDVVHLSDDVSPFLRLTGGSPTQQLSRLVLPELRAESQAALLQAHMGQGAVHTRPVRVEVGGQQQRVRLLVRPVAEGDLYHVVFETLPEDGGSPRSPTPEEVDALKALELELVESREQLHLIIEEYETSHEELQAQNEELQSMNEELRSTAEELETATEESQSMAEELQTLNSELKDKVEEVTRAKSDLENLIVSTEIATLFLDFDLNIKRFTPRVRDHFQIMSSDLGRPLSDLAHRFGSADLLRDVEAVMETLEVRERELQDDRGRWYLVHVRPYRTHDNRFEGTVVTFVDITARKEAEEALRRGELRYRALVEASAQMVWTTDARGTVVEDSPSWCAFTGQTYEQWKGWGWLDAVHPDDREHARTFWRETVASEQPAQATFRLRHVGGTWRWTAARAVPLRREDGSLSGWVGMNTDISEQCEAEQRLRESEERFRLIIEGVSEYAIFMLDLEGRVSMWNTGAERICGYTEEEALGQPAAIIFTPEDRASGRLEAEMLEAARQGQASDDRWHVRKDGSRFWASGVMMPLYHASGALRGYAKVLRDNTERRAAEEALRESEARFRQMAEAVPDIVFTTTPEGIVEYVSPRREQITGLKPETALGTPMWPESIHPDDRAHAQAQWQKALAQQKPFEVRYRLRNESDGYYWFIARARPIFGGSEIVRWFGTLTDVDALTRAEQQVQALNGTLEQRVQERTEQVRQLAASLTLAEQQERQRIAYILHDDLQQVLYGAGMTLSMLRAPRDEAEKERLQEQMDRVLGQALQTTRLLAVELSPPVLAASDATQLLQWLVLRMEDQYGLRVTLETDGACRIEQPAVRVLLYQVLRELLFNIVKHAGTDQATLTASASGDEVILLLQDSGQGFDPAAVEARRPQDGGLGLFSAQSRLELIGGRLTIESSPGDGTRFTLAVPAGPKSVPEIA